MLLRMQLLHGNRLEPRTGLMRLHRLVQSRGTVGAMVMVVVTVVTILDLHGAGQFSYNQVGDVFVAIVLAVLLGDAVLVDGAVVAVLEA